jgi:hypothetical protein
MFRIDSSNFNPAPFWAAGVQMAALNYQTPGVAMRLQRAWFRQNGRCGYVLKPPYMRSRMKEDAAACVSDPSLLLRPATDGRGSLQLCVTILNPLKLPCSASSHVSCTVSVHGATEDTSKFKTKVVAAADATRDAAWQQTFTFALQRPEVAILYLAIHEHRDIAPTLLAYFAAPVCALRRGLRSCPLRSFNGKKIPFTSLLCKLGDGGSDAQGI